jgi:hypothetical protein
MLAIALLEAGQLEVVGKEGPLAILPPAGGPTWGTARAKPIAERSWIEARQEPALRHHERPRVNLLLTITAQHPALQRVAQKAAFIVHPGLAGAPRSNVMSVT